jgi:hypothetical protein
MKLNRNMRAPHNFPYTSGSGRVASYRTSDNKGCPLSCTASSHMGGVRRCPNHHHPHHASSGHGFLSLSLSAAKDAASAAP